MLIFPRKYQHSGQLFRPGTVFSLFFRKFATKRENADFCEKVRFFRKNQLFWYQEFHFRPHRSKAYETNAFLGVLGSIFLHFALFH